MSSKYNLRTGVYEKIKINCINPLLSKSVKFFESVNKDCCDIGINRRRNKSNQDANCKKSKTNIKIERVIKTKSRKSQYFCLIREKSIKYFEWLPSDQLNGYQKRLLENPKDYKRKLNNFFEKFKNKCVAEMIHIRLSAIRFSIKIDEEVFRKSELNSLFLLMNKKDYFIEINEQQFNKIFKYNVKDLEIQDIGGIHSTVTIDFPLRIFKPIFRYRKNKEKYLIIDKKQKMFYKASNYVKFFVRIKLDNHLKESGVL